MVYLRHRCALQLFCSNLVDEIWTNQPPMPCQPVRVHPLKYAGVSVPEKLESVRKLVLEARATSLVVMAMDEVRLDLVRFHFKIIWE